MGALIVGFGWYTAVKAAYISTTFSTLVVERNLIYVAPLLFVGTAMFFERPLTRWWAVAGAAGLTLSALLLAYQYKMDVRIYSDAPGFSLLQAANRTYAWTPDRARNVLIGFVVLSLLVIVLPRVLPWGTRQVLALVALLLLVWGIAGQMSAASASNTFSEEISADIDPPFDWIDRATGGAPTLYLGQRLTDYNGIWQMEFWNRSLKHVWSTDGSAPGPGPTLSPDLVNAATGEITQPPTAVEYVVVDPGIDIVGTPVESHAHYAAGTKTFWRLVKIVPPLRLQNSTRGVTQDGWASDQTDYTQFSTPGNRPGFAVVRVHRLGWGGKDDAEGRLPRRDPRRRARPQGQAARARACHRIAARSRSTGSRTARSCCGRRLLRSTSTSGSTPRSSRAKIDPRDPDTRELGAQVGYSFSPAANVDSVAPRLRCRAARSRPLSRVTAAA